MISFISIHYQEVKSRDLINSIKICMNKKKSEKVHKSSSIKQEVLEKLQSLKPSKNATATEAVESLVKQAQFYTNYLVSKHSSRQAGENHKNRKRGHFQTNEDENLEEENFTRLQRQPEILEGGELKYYQLVGLNWMISLYQSGINGILADDMGLGKTIQTISMLAFIEEYKNISRPFLIIGPKVTLGNWTNQIKKWLPKKRVVKLLATKEERSQLIDTYLTTGDFDIVVTSFEGVRICLSALRKIKWHYIVIDEAHKLKNDESQISKTIRKLDTDRKLLLTGTPLQNNLKELWSLLNFLLPEIFDSSDLFDNWFQNYEVEEGKQLSQQEIQKKNATLIGQLHKILKPFMLRRTKSEVEKTLPPKKEIHIYVGLTDMQLRVYKSLLQSRNVTEGEKRTYLNLLMQLRKACNHPYLFPDVEDKTLPLLGEHLIENSGKMIVLDRLLKKLYDEKGHRVLIFSQMTNLLDILQDYCSLRDYPHCRIDGSTDMTSREEQIEDFMSETSNKFVFLLSTRAGGLGINLTSADTVIIYDSDWNPQMDLQAMDRAHRIGQKNKVNVYRLITQNTVEEKIIERQTVKLKWDSLVIQQSKTAAQKGNKNLTKEEMKDMLQFGASTIIKATKGTISDEQIDQLLLRGQTKTNELNTQIQNKLKSFQSNLVDFSMNSINIFDFMQEDERRKKEDSEALLSSLQKEVLGEMRSRREKGKFNYYENFPDEEQHKISSVKNKIMKRVELPDFQFFEQKEKLIELLEKEINCADDQSLSPEEYELKEQLLETGFRTWTKNDFMRFVSGCEKYGRQNYDRISKKLARDISEVQLYAKVFWTRIDELADKEKILRLIQNGEEKLQTQKQQEQLLEWKSRRCYEVDFNHTFYGKCKSKFFTYENDKFLANETMKYGLKNMAVVKEHLKNDSKWRFDYFFRTRTETELVKRLGSVFKVLEKEKDFEQMGFDSKERKKQAKARKMAEKQMSSILEKQNEDNFD